ncbi:MAG: hypothetical protein ACKO1L_02835 [Brachymonas sp.]
MRRLLNTLFLTLCIGVLSACGDGSSLTAVGADAEPAIDGGVVKGPVSGSQVCVYAIGANGVRGAKIPLRGPGGSTAQISAGCWVTAADGLYNFRLPASTQGDVLVEATGGQYCASEQPVGANGLCPSSVAPLSMGGQALSTVVNVPANSAGQTIYISPISSAAVAGLGGNLSATGFNSRFTQLAGQLNLGNFTPTTPPTTSSLPLLGTISQYIAQGGSLTAVITSLSNGTSSFPATTSSTGGSGSTTGTSTSSAFPPLGTATFSSTNWPANDEATFVNAVAGSYDVAIYRAPATNPEWIGPGRITVARVGTATTAQLTTAGGFLIGAWNSANVFVSIIHPSYSPGWLFGNGLAGSASYGYMSINMQTDGSIYGSAGGLGEVAFRNNIIAYGTVAPSALSALAGTYSGPQQANTCGGPSVTLTFTANAVSMNGTHSLACSSVTYSATWDGNDDYIAPGNNGESVIRIDEAKGGGSSPAGGFWIRTNGLTTGSVVINALVYGPGFDGNVQSDNLVKQGALATRAQLTNKRLKHVSPSYPVSLALTSGSGIPAPFSSAGNNQISFNSAGQLVYKGTTFEYANVVDTPSTSDQRTFTYNRLDAGPIASYVVFTIRTDMSFVSGTWSQTTIMGSTSGTLSVVP